MLSCGHPRHNQQFNQNSTLECQDGNQHNQLDQPRSPGLPHQHNLVHHPFSTSVASAQDVHHHGTPHTCLFGTPTENQHQFNHPSYLPSSSKPTANPLPVTLPPLPILGRSNKQHQRKQQQQERTSVIFNMDFEQLFDACPLGPVPEPTLVGLQGQTGTMPLSQINTNKEKQNDECKQSRDEKYGASCLFSLSHAHRLTLCCCAPQTTLAFSTLKRPRKMSTSSQSITYTGATRVARIRVPRPRRPSTPPFPPQPSSHPLLVPKPTLTLATLNNALQVTCFLPSTKYLLFASLQK